MDLREIVVATDFSDSAGVGLRAAAKLAARHGAHLHLIYAGNVEGARPDAYEIDRGKLDEFHAYVRSQLENDRVRLQDEAATLSAQGLSVDAEVVDGLPDEAIARTAEDRDADLIVVGTHGRLGPSRFFLGSVAEHVVRYAKRDVLVARARRTYEVRFQRILVATDFTPSAERALARAIQLADPGAVIDLVHLWRVPYVAGDYAGPASSGRLAVQLRTEVTSAAARDGAMLVDRYRSDDIELGFELIQDHVAHGIQQLLDDRPYDLVAMGSHGRRGLSRLLLGSVAEMTVRHAPCSALVARG